MYSSTSLPSYFFYIFICVKKVYTYTGSHCSQCGIGITERRCNDTDCEEYKYCLPQISLCGKHRKYIVIHFREDKVHLSCQCQQKDPQAKKQEIQRDERNPVTIHILLCLAQVFTGKIFLHHVLIQPRHHNYNENATQELLEKILS